jgi:serine/threonine-protein kinase
VPPDHRVDIYALGITLYELLTGRVPFEGDSFMNVLSKHANKQVPALRDVNPRLNVSAALENLIRHALRKDRNQRLQHMRDMALALEAVPEMPPVPFRLSRPSLTPVRGSAPSDPQLAAPVKSATTDYDTGMPNWRRRGLFAALSAAGLALGAGVAFYGETPSSARTASHETAPALPPVTAAAPGEEAHGAPPRPADEGAALDLVTVRVTTEPAGASVKLAGGEQVCAATPCAFDVVRGAPVSLLAQRGAQQATTNLTPRAATDLHLVLALTKPPKKPASPPRVPHDDLKVPALFQAHAK